MVVVHFAVCDYQGCENRVPADEIAWGGATIYAAPKDWKQAGKKIGGKDFCSWACVSGYAAQMAKEDGN